MKIVYTVDRLIDKQPKKLKEKKEFKNLILLLKNESGLSKIRLKRKIYFDFDKCRININDLKNYIIKKRLPYPIFFINFYKIKFSYLKEKKIEDEKRKIETQNILKKLDNHTLSYLKLFYNYEKKMSGNKPEITFKSLPKTPKQATVFINQSIFFYYNFFLKMKIKLLKKYLTFDQGFMDYQISKYLFGFQINEKINGSKIAKKYRELSKKYHPDCGGNDEKFKILTECRNILLNKIF